MRKSKMEEELGCCRRGRKRKRVQAGI